MLSLPDFKEKQLLFAHAEWGSKSFLRFANDNIVFLKDGELVGQLVGFQSKDALKDKLKEAFGV